MIGIASAPRATPASRSRIRASASAARVPITTDPIATVKATIRLFCSAGQNELLANSRRYQSSVRPVSGRLVSADSLKLNRMTRMSGVAMKTMTASAKTLQARSAAGFMALTASAARCERQERPQGTTP